MNGDLFPEVVRAVPPGSTPSWFTDYGWFLGWEHELLRLGAIPRPFDLDPFAHPLAPVSRLILQRGGKIYTGSGGLEDDGLAQSWAGRVVFCNPPYDAETLDSAAPKLVREIERAWVGALLPAWTDRHWWHRSGIERLRRAGVADVRFVEGRLTFGWPDNPEHQGAEGAMFASCTITFPRLSERR